MRTIHILLDSLNKDYLKCYNPDAWFETPNMDRLANRGIRFDKHFVGSLPCMPARREILTGRSNFLESSWGPIEPWDDPMGGKLRDKGVYSHLITDHYHYFHRGGSGYHDTFNSWEFIRGQEGDVWRPIVDYKKPPEGVYGKGVARSSYWNNRYFLDQDRENDLAYSTPQCFDKGIEFLDLNKDTDNWHLQLECFDPHEPFDCPQKYLDALGDKWDRPYFTWPNYAPVDRSKEDDETITHIRKCYAGTLMMADVWLGKFLDKMDEHDLWKDTVVVLSTDHGHLLGEHEYWAKNYMFDYRELVNIPMIVCAPNQGTHKTSKALTGTIDMMPTFLELHGVDRPDNLHGKSIAHLIENDGDHHDALLYGYFAMDVNLTDGQYTYCRQALPDSVLYNHYMPSSTANADRETILKSQVGSFLKHDKGISQYRVECPSRHHHNAPDFNPIYDIDADPDQANPIRDEALENKLANKMTELLERYDAPDCQYERLGLSKATVDA